jgi:hypothetical protein
MLLIAQSDGDLGSNACVVESVEPGGGPRRGLPVRPICSTASRKSAVTIGANVLPSAASGFNCTPPLRTMKAERHARLRASCSIVLASTMSPVLNGPTVENHPIESSYRRRKENRDVIAAALRKTTSAFGKDAVDVSHGFRVVDKVCGNYGPPQIQ